MSDCKLAIADCELTLIIKRAEFKKRAKTFAINVARI
jgi:hypothetical protein